MDLREEELRVSKEVLADNGRLKKLLLQQEKEKTVNLRILANLSESYIILNEEFNVVSANKSFIQNFNTTEEECLGKSIFSICNFQFDTPELKKHLNGLKFSDKINQSSQFSHEFEVPGNRTICINAKTLPGIEEDQNLLLLEIEDTTESVNAKKKFQESVHRYHELVFSSPSYIAILNGRDLKIEVVNDSMLENWGKGRDVVGKALIKEVLPEMQKQGMEEIFHKVYDTGVPFHAHEMPLYHNRNGEFHLGYFDFVYQPQKDIKGKIIGVAVIATDVTAQAKLHQKIREDERKFRQMADLIPDKISNGDPNSYTFYYNKSWLDYSGYDLEELKALGWQHLVHPEDEVMLKKVHKKALLEGTDFEAEIRCLNKDGEYKWHLLRAVQVKDEDGNLNSWLSSATEIHKIKQDEKRKEDFLKLVSHELKTPVTSIKGYVQLLLAMLNTPEKTSVDSLPLNSSLQRIDAQISRLTRLISEMLDLSRLEEGRLNLQKDIFNISTVVDECIQDISYSNPNAQIEVVKEANFEIIGDKDRIGQVIINFVTNAIKYSPENNKIKLCIFREKNGKGSVCVKDKGIGINKKDQKNIFKRFYRVSGNNEETYSGFGIGLYLAKEIVERHNGQIRVKSNPGEGSEFMFTLPVVV